MASKLPCVRRLGEALAGVCYRRWATEPSSACERIKAAAQPQLYIQASEIAVNAGTARPLAFRLPRAMLVGIRASSFRRRRPNVSPHVRQRARAPSQPRPSAGGRRGSGLASGPARAHCRGQLRPRRRRASRRGRAPARARPATGQLHRPGSAAPDVHPQLLGTWLSAARRHRPEGRLATDSGLVFSADGDLVRETLWDREHFLREFAHPAPLPEPSASLAHTPRSCRCGARTTSTGSSTRCRGSPCCRPAVSPMTV